MSQDILVIDDSRDNCDLLKLLLEANGFRTDCALNGAEALSLMKNNLELPRLILLDANMPVMDGFHFRVEQEKDVRLKNIPVVVMTGDCSENMDERMNFPHSFLPKPLSLQGIIGHVEAFFSSHRATLRGKNGKPLH